jgi:S-(hydroxymethyl)glutathione dehydrogenase/alcohol dehydrogenase
VTLVIKTTIAAILQSSTQQLVVDEIQMPDELFAGQILVKVLSSGICGAQINEIDAIKGPDRFLPHLLGHEGFGTVLDTGPGVTTVAPGDMVVMHWRPGAGMQSAPPIYKWQGQQLNAGWVTTLNNHAVVSENRVTRLSTRIDDKNVIPLLGCALTTALGVLENDARVGFRDSLLIFGGGGVGLLLVKLARLMGVRDITVVDTKIEKLKKALEIGASNGILFVDKPDSLFQLKKLFGSEFPTVAIDTTGNTDAIEICYEISSAKARVVLVGVPKKGMTASFYTLPLHFGKSIKGSEGGGSNPDIDIPILLKLISQGHLSFDDYPTHSFPLSEVNNAISQIRNGVIGRMIINFE